MKQRDSFITKQMTKFLLILFILAAIAGVSLYRIGMLEWGATLINRDNSLSTEITRSDLPYLFGGLLLGIALCDYSRRSSARPRVRRATLLALCAIAILSLALSLSWDALLLHSIHGTLVRDFPERLQHGPPSSAWALLSGILLFALAYLAARFTGSTFVLRSKSHESV